MFPLGNLATATGPARADTPASRDVLPCWFSTRPANAASLPPLRIATFPLQQPRQRMRNRAEMGGTRMTTRDLLSLRDHRLEVIQTRDGFRISLDPSSSDQMDQGPQADNLFLLCPLILNSQRGLSLWTKKTKNPLCSKVAKISLQRKYLIDTLYFRKKILIFFQRFCFIFVDFCHFCVCFNTKKMFREQWFVNFLKIK